MSRHRSAQPPAFRYGVSASDQSAPRAEGQLSMKQEDPTVKLESPGFSRGEDINRTIKAFAVAAFLVGLAGVTTGEASATPGQCFTSPWGGFCDGDLLPDGTYRHCEGAMGFANCFYVRPVPVSVDPRGWVPA